MIPQTMEAIVCFGPEDYRHQEVPVPQVGPGEVLLRVLAVGICASDAKCWSGAPLFWGDATRTGYCQAPVIPGHEFSGEVVALGPGVADLRLGDRVVSEQIVPCGLCRYCRHGQYWMCQRHDIYGFRQASQGAMAQYVKLPHGSINYVLPPGLSAEAGAFVEPLGCSIHAVDRGDIHLGDVVVVAGCGPLGLGMVAAARLRGPRLLIALDTRAARLDIARACGADLTLDPHDGAVREVLAVTDGYGCDVYIEASGAPDAVQQGLEMVRKLGTFVEFSVMRQPSTVDWTIIGDTKELNIRGSHLSPHTYPIAIDMLNRGQLPLDRIITHRLPLRSFDEGMAMVVQGQTSVKVQLIPEA